MKEAGTPGIFGASFTTAALWDDDPTAQHQGVGQTPDRRSPSPATGDGPTCPTPLALALATAAIALGIARRTRRNG